MANPDRVAFTVFGRDIYWYGVLMAVGILVAIFLANKEEKRKRLPKDTILDCCLLIIPLGVICARLYYVIFEWQYYSVHPIEILYIWEGGLAFYGALIGGILGLWIYCRHKKMRMLRLMDCIAPGLVLAQAIGRWGNYFNQEAFGLPVNNGELLWFPLCVRIDGLHYFNGEICSNPYHLATFFYESLWCFLVFVFLWSYRKKFKHDGDAFLSYVFLYGFERMLVEGLRGDSLYLIQPGTLFAEGIRVSQLGSFLAVVAVAVFVLIRRHKEKKLGQLIWPAPLPAAEAATETARAPEDGEVDAVVLEQEDAYLQIEVEPQGEEEPEGEADAVSAEGDAAADTADKAPDESSEEF